MRDRDEVRRVLVKKVALKGHLRDRRFNTILQQGLGKVAESLAKRLLIAEGLITLACSSIQNVVSSDESEA